jgi:hypothetical protein
MRPADCMAALNHRVRPASLTGHWVPTVMCSPVQHGWSNAPVVVGGRPRLSHSGSWAPVGWHGALSSMHGSCTACPSAGHLAGAATVPGTLMLHHCRALSGHRLGAQRHRQSAVGGAKVVMDTLAAAIGALQARCWCAARVCATDTAQPKQRATQHTRLAGPGRDSGKCTVTRAAGC